ncbi:MAG: GEVED domain-containing protein [Crocinitomix sp.]|nr:GEVED domain-containing protein [Crocinitomix sp.]
MFPQIVVSFLLLSFVSIGYSQRSYKELMQDNTVNFYEVCEVAEAYFATIDKDVKGSGWKGYQRWKYENESKYHPSGDRSNEDPFFVRNAYERFLADNPPVLDKVLYDGGWEEVGPATVDSITGHYAAGLGRLETFYVNPTDANQMYIGTRSGGFWKSTDGGDTWSGGTTDFLFACGVNTLSVSPTDADEIIINLRNSGNGYSHGIYRSTDAGDTWAETDFNPVDLGLGGLGSNFQINRIVYNPEVSEQIFIGTNYGLYRSNDDLDTWVLETGGNITDIEFHPTDADIIYIYDRNNPNRNKVIRSTDGGLSWIASVDIVGNSNNTSVQLDVTPECEDCIYFASGNGIWKSFDAGLTFEFASNPASGSQGFAVSDEDSTKMIYGYVDCFNSDDGGYTFDQTTWWSLYDGAHGPGTLQERHANSENYIHADLREAECVNGVFYVATDGYFGKSEDNGLTWEHLNHDMSIRENYTLGASQSNHYRTIVGSQDNGTSIKHKTVWLEYTGGDGMEGIIHPLNSDWMISSYQYGQRTKTFNGGLTRAGASPPGHSSYWVAPMAYDPNDHLTIYHFGENVHKTENFTSSWVVTGSPSFVGQIKEAAIAENNTDMLIASRNQYIERSMDGGVTWVNIKGSLPNYTITDIAFDPNDDNTMIVTYNRYQDDGSKVYITHDIGATWTNITENLNDMPIRGAVIDHSNESNIYLAGEIGVYVKTMEATEWELYNDELPNCMINELEVVNGSNTLRAATWGRGVWEYTLRDRNTYPAILLTEITDQPTYDLPKEGVDQFVTSQIYYDGDVTEAYIEWSIDAPTFENAIAMENVSDSTWVTETAIPDYPEGTKIYFKVYAVGDADDTTETYKFMYEVRPFEYCDAIGHPGTGSDYIVYVELEDISNVSGQDYYGDFTDQITTLYLDSTYTLQADLNYVFDPNTIGTWIDYNYNAVFEEEEFIEMSDFDADDQSFGTFTVPAHATLNDTVRMRVRSAYAAELDPCGGAIAGDVEDYSIVLSCAHSFAEMDAASCYEYVSPSGLYTWGETGVYMDTVSNTNGCDSIISVNLVIENTATTISPIVCDSYTSPSGDYVWTETGVYMDTLTNDAGCDSLITVELTIDVETVADFTITACDSYESPSGIYTWTETGVYMDTLTNDAGCDSVMTYDLTINTVNVDVIAGDYELSADEIGLIYQWLDCNDDWAEIPGATDQTYSPLENGSYAVVITQDGCTDTSDCYDITALSIGSFENAGVRLYPNPTNGIFSLDFGALQSSVYMTIHNPAGQIVCQKQYSEAAKIDVELNVATGVYFITLQLEGAEELRKKIVID